MQHKKTSVLSLPLGSHSVKCVAVDKLARHISNVTEFILVNFRQRRIPGIKAES